MCVCARRNMLMWLWGRPDPTSPVLKERKSLLSSLRFFVFSNYGCLCLWPNQRRMTDMDRSCCNALVLVYVAPSWLARAGLGVVILCCFFFNEPKFHSGPLCPTAHRRPVVFVCNGLMVCERCTQRERSRFQLVLKRDLRNKEKNNRINLYGRKERKKKAERFDLIRDQMAEIWEFCMFWKKNLGIWTGQFALSHSLGSWNRWLWSFALDGY